MGFPARRLSVRICALGVVLASMLAVAGCSDRKAPKEMTRLVRERFAAAGDLTPAPPVFSQGASWSVGGTDSIDSSGQTLILGAGKRPATLRLPLEISADHYSEFRVRMRVDRGSSCRLAWRSAIEPASGPGIASSMPIFADDQHHTYRLPLRNVSGSLWVGTIDEIVFIPSDLVANVEIESMELVYDPPKGPIRITINHETHEALFGTRESWKVVVPQEAIFEVYIGMSEFAWKGQRSDGVDFVVTLHDGESEPLVLASETMDPVRIEEDRFWRMIQSDLSAYAGQEVTLNLTVDPHGQSTADYAYWGGPMVYRRRYEGESTPVILISCDTLRADRLGCYGNPRDTSPNLDAFRKDAVLFENAICQETFTLSSHTTMFTGLNPTHHGVSRSANLPESVTTLAERLSDIGYLAAGFTGHRWWLMPQYGLSHGFDLYETPSGHMRNVEEVIAKGLEWLGTHDSDRLFLFLHNYDIHAKIPRQKIKLPYFPERSENLYFANQVAIPPSLRFEDPKTPAANQFLYAMQKGEVPAGAAELEYLLALYDDCIRYVDRHVNDVFEELKTRGLYEGALVIVTSDHGEDFYEHGRMEHGSVFEACTRVPLLIKFPHGRFAGETVSSVVQLTDIYPTVLDTLGLPDYDTPDGQSLLALLDGREEPANKAYIQRFNLRAVRGDTWKLLNDRGTNQRQLFDIKQDAGEQTNVAEQHPRVMDELSADLDSFFAFSREGWNFAIRSDREEGLVSVRLTVITETPIENAQLFLNENAAPGSNLDFFTLSEDRHTLDGHFRLPKWDRDELLIRPTKGGERFNVTFTTNEEVSIAIGDEAPVVTRHLQAVLEPGEKAYPKPEALLSGPAEERPLIAVWFEAPSVERPAAEALSDEALEELGALGYLGD